MLEREIYVCQCHSLDHILSFWYDEEDDMFVAETKLLPNRSFWKRFVNAITYLFNFKSKYFQFEEFLFKPEDKLKLFNYLGKSEINELKEKINKLEKELEDRSYDNNYHD